MLVFVPWTFSRFAQRKHRGVLKDFAQFVISYWHSWMFGISQSRFGPPVSFQKFLALFVSTEASWILELFWLLPFTAPLQQRHPLHHDHFIAIKGSYLSRFLCQSINLFFLIPLAPQTSKAGWNQIFLNFCSFRVSQDGCISLDEFACYLGQITELPPVDTLPSSVAWLANNVFLGGIISWEFGMRFLFQHQESDDFY